MTSATNLIILADNAHDGVTPTVSSTLNSTFPASNLAVVAPGARWQASTATGETVRYDHGEAVPIDTIAIVNHNGTLDGTVTVTITNDASYATDGTYQETVDLWPPIYGYGQQYGKYYGGYVPTDELGVYLPLRLIRLSSQVEARYMEYSFTDSGISSGGIRVGYLMAGAATEFERNFGFGYEMDEVDLSDLDFTEGGAPVIDEGVVVPEWRITLPALARDEALTKIRDIKRRRGRRLPIVVSLFPTASTAIVNQTSIYGLARDWSPARHFALDRATQTFTVRGLA